VSQGFIGWYHNPNSYLVPQKSWVSNPLASRWKKTLLCPLPQGLTWCHVLYHKGLTWGPANSLSINSASVKKKKKKLLMFSQNSFSQIWRNFSYPSIIITITCWRNAWNSNCGRRRWWVKRRLQQMIFQAEEETSSDATKRRASKYVRSSAAPLQQQRKNLEELRGANLRCQFEVPIRVDKNKRSL
jgi:hypothetical protein